MLYRALLSADIRIWIVRGHSVDTKHCVALLNRASQGRLPIDERTLEPSLLSSRLAATHRQ